MNLVRFQHALATLSLTLCVASGCAAFRSGASDAAAPIPPTDPERTYAVLLNGGGRKEINYQSHLIHLKQLAELLKKTRIESSHVAIFSGDGSDPSPDLATRELVEDDELWLLPRIPETRAARPEIVYVDSQIEGFELQPARKDALRTWFETTGKELRAGDTLLLYVTDHGEKNAQDTANNTITLWKQELSVAELREMLAGLDPGVRVVQVMSQCFSGAFARTMYTGDGSGDPTGNVCGYYSVTAERPAYGCYPENRGKDGIGHSHTLFEALDVLGWLPEAHRRVQVTDRTPDVPHATSDFYLEQLLERAAKASGAESAALVDELLGEAWRDRAAWEPEIRLIDRIGRTFGTFSPRSLQELEAQSKTLPEFSKQLRTYAERWTAALEAAKYENWQRFLEARPQWRERLVPNPPIVGDAGTRRATSQELLAELEAFTREDDDRYERLASLYRKAQDASQAAYRTDVRLAAVLRMQAILTAVAGRVYLAQRAAPEERATYERLVACEALALGPPPEVRTAAALDPPEPFPTLADERSLVETVMPAWMGIEYRPVPAALRRKDLDDKGPVVITTVFPDSPAQGAGLKTGDIVLGPPGEPFEETHAIREWTMRSEIGRPAPLTVLREDENLEVVLRPAAFPVKMPELPGPPPVGADAPPLKLGMLRGDRDVTDAKSKLLFFWATWCVPCKFSVPEVLAFAKSRGVELIAITDEDPALLEAFFAKNEEPLADAVAVDPLRISFRAYGVSGTPTFVLVDEHAVVRHYQTGYDARVGLRVDGWKWSAAPAKQPAS